MDAVSVLALVLAAIIASALLKSSGSIIWPFPQIILAIFVFKTGITYFSGMYTELSALVPGDITGEAFSTLLKVTGICICTDIAGTAADEAEYKTLSQAVFFFGRVSMMLCILPLTKELIEILT